METFLYISLDSRDRDRPDATSPDAYTYVLEDTLKNVTSVILAYAVYEKAGTDFYVNLHIEELTPKNVWSKSHVARGAFAQLPLVNYLNEFRADTFRSEKRFAKPVAKLSKLTIRFVKHDGSPYPMKDHLLIFRVSQNPTSSSLEFGATGELRGDDASLRILDLPSNFTADELSQAYLVRKQALIQQGAHTSELVMIKAAYKDLVRRRFHAA